MSRPTSESKDIDFSDDQSMKIEKELVLMRGYKYGMPKTDGTFQSNLYHWTMNEHPIISLFCADWSHPFGKCDRFMVLLSTLTW